VEREERIERGEGGWGAAEDSTQVRSTAGSCIWGSGWMCGEMGCAGLDGKRWKEMDAGRTFVGLGA